MKSVLVSVVIVSFILTSCSSVQKSVAVADTKTYQVTNDSASKILKGYINRNIIESDTSFKWFKENMKWGNADPSAIQAIEANNSNLHFVVFGGTWCHDTQSLLPVFYRLADKSGVGNDKITLIGVDRAKTALNDLHKVFNVTMVPTFIVMKEGKEIGRVVEYGKSGAIDKEIGQIISGANAK